MRLTDYTSLVDLFNKFRSWVSWGTTSSGAEIEMPSDNSCQIHPDHDRDGVGNHKSIKYHCRGCSRVFCEVGIQGSEPVVLDSGSAKLNQLDDAISIKCCKFCGDVDVRRYEGKKKNFEKVHPRDSPDPEPPSPCFSGSEKITDSSINCESFRSDSLTSFFEAEGHNHLQASSSVNSFSAHPSPVSVGLSPSRYRSEEEVAEDSGRLFFSPASEHCHNIFDRGSHSFSSRHDFYYKSVGSSPSDSPSRIDFISNRGGHTVQHEKDGSPVSCDGPSEPETMAVLFRPRRATEDVENSDYCSDDMSVFRAQYDKSQKQMDFEKSGFIWYPPPPNDEDDEGESNYFQYDDDDDDVGDSAAMFSSSSSLSSIFPARERQQDVTKEPLRALVQAHFRALVSQLLHGEGIKTIEENGAEEWIDVVTNIAWQAANFVKPDTSRGGSMDPCDYVKVKCVASGGPSGSTVVKGVVCSKNIKHKRMTSQYKNPRILILGGSLEYQRAQNELASFNTLLQQEIDHLKTIISRIEALHPNVLLVEKSVSSYAQEYLLEKEISLVLNVKRPLLERISKCTGAIITPSIESISTTRLGHCELFRLERVSEEHEVNSQSSKKPSKTLMFFEGCPRRLGCTVLLRGTCREELKKIKHVVLYAVFAAYHLSLETSFLADEGATLPKMSVKPPVVLSEKAAADGGAISSSTTSAVETSLELMPNAHASDDIGVDSSEMGGVETNFKYGQPSIAAKNQKLAMTFSGAPYVDPSSPDGLELHLHAPFKNVQKLESPSEHNFYQPEFLENPTAPEPKQPGAVPEIDNCERIEEKGMSSEYFSAADTNQSILVSFSSRCVLKGTVCERSRLLRIKFYCCFDKPLGRYLRDDLFDQTSSCRSCKEPAEAHVLCYTHQQGNLTVNVKHIPSMKLPGEVDGKIWMWHRCLKCAHVNGVPPATRRVVMSDAAWGLSFGKFLELSFSNHATANRVATCGHSLQRDCLRYYGFGSMVAFFRYSPIDILSVFLPPSMLEFNGLLQQEWLRKEVIEIMNKMETFYLEISEVLERVEQKSISFGHELLATSELRKYITDLKGLLKKEKADYNDLLDLAMDSSESGQSSIDVLELNRLQQSLLIGSHIWNRRLYSLDSLVETKSNKHKNVDILGSQIRELRIDLLVKDGNSENGSNCIGSTSSNVFDDPANRMHSGDENPIIRYNQISEEEITGSIVFSGTLSSDEPNLSERIDSAWTGSDQVLTQNQSFHMPVGDGLSANAVGLINGTNSPTSRRLKSPLRFNSFDSALRLQERLQRAMLSSSIHLSTLGSFHASGDFRQMVRDPLRYSISNIMRTYSQMWPRDAHKLNALISAPAIVSSTSLFTTSARMLLPQTGHNDTIIAVYDDEPTSIISYALCSKEYGDWVSNKLNEHGGDLSGNKGIKEGVASSSFSTWQSFGAMDLDNIPYASYGSEDATSSVGASFREPKKSPHLRISFGDESSSAGGKVNFSVTCYFAKQFDSLRQKCCPCELDFLRSLSRCKRWSAEGGKSNVYFAKSMDERFIIKQATKTELDSFVEFAPEYFKYLNDCLSSGSPTCLAKILGLYQVTVKHFKGSKETKMDLMVMENLFFKRSISWTYDLKGSVRGRYNPDTSGKNKVLWDMNLLEALRTKPIFLGSKAKRRLERAIWNDTAFLASVDVMDYSLLVGVDEERQELVLGIIDFMRQYTWDKHLETWVKAAGILGGPKNASPTIVSPKQYKKRFRKAMTSYFLTVPDQWSA